MGRPILRQEDRVSFLKTLFESGQSLDLLDISGQDRSVLAPELQSFYADADTAFQSIDAERLYDKAKSLGIPDKYPSFYEYLENLQKELEEDIASAHEERTLTVEQPEEDELETQEQPQEEAEDLSMRDVVTKNLVEGEHTGKKRDSEVYRKGDEFREQLNAERRQADEEARKRYQADSYESSGQRQAEPQAPAYSRAEEPVTERQEVYQRTDTPRQDADQNAGSTETNRADVFRREEQPGRTPVMPGYAADVRRAEAPRSADSTNAGYTDHSRNNTARYEGINRMNAPREDAAPQSGAYEQERPAAAEDTNRSNSRRYQADSYESSGQRQAEPQASSYNRADEPVGGQKETYPRADAPRRDADRTAGSTETNQADVFRREEQPGKTPVTPGYAADARRAEESRSAGSTNAGYTDPSRNNTARYEGINRMDAPREDAAPQSGIYEQERPAETEGANRSDSRRYQADSYESSGQRQAEPQAPAYNRADEPVGGQKETYQRTTVPHRDADQTAGSTETNRADIFRREEQPKRTPVTPGYATDVRHEETNRTDAPRENAAPQSGAYEQERPAAAEDANRSNSRRYQADSYESSGQRQAKPQASVYSRAEEPVSEQKEAYQQADAPHRDADRTAGSTETNRADVFRREEQPGRTPVTPGYATDVRHEETNRTDALRENAAPQSGAYEQERPAAAEDANRSGSRRYQADSYESSGQRQAEPQASAYNRADEPVDGQKETYQRTDVPHRDADQTAGSTETNRADVFRREEQPGRTPVTSGYAADTRRAEEPRSAGSTDAGYTNPSRNNVTRHEETNRTDAPQENAAPQSGAYEQERPAAAEDANRSDSRRYQADSYESSGQRQAEPQAPAYNRADEPVGGQKETYQRTDVPHRDADQTAGSTETNRPDAFRREEQPGRTPATPGYAADTRRAEEPRSAGSTDVGYTNPSRNNATRHEEANRTEAPRESAALQQHTYEQERPAAAEDANRSDSRRYQADSYESSGQRQAAEAYAKNAQEQASNAFQTRAPKGEPSNNRVEAPQAVPGSQSAKDHIGHATKQGTGTGIAATVIAATSATSAAATEIEATVRAVQNATGNPSITNRQIADSYARTGQMDAVTAAMAAKQSASSYHRTEQQAYVNTARQTFGYVGKSPKLEGQKPDGAQTVDIGVYGVRNGNVISIKTDGASNAAKKYTIRSDGTIQINGTVANVYDTGNEKVFVGWRGATVQQDSVIAPNGQRYKLGADKTVVSATGTIFQTVKDVEATARQGQGIAVSMASIFHETGAKAADFSDSGAGFSTKDFAKVITPKSTQALMKKGVFGKAILKQQRMFSVVLQTEVMAHATRSMKVLGSARIMVDHYDSILASISNNTAHMLKMNAFLENKYLVQAADLAGFEQKLTNKLAQFKLSTDVKELKALIASKSLSGEKLDAAKQFLALQQEKQIRGILAGKMKAARQTLTAQGFSLNPEDLKKALADRSISAADYKTISSYLRLQKKARFIIVNNGMLSTDKLNLSHLEQAFLSASMPFSAKEAGLPSNIKAIKKLLKKDKKTNTLTKQQKKLAKAMLRLNRSLKLVNFSQAVALGLVGSAFKSVKSITKKGIRTVKDITNRYLSQDYTMRGLLLLTGLGSGIVKHTKRAYKVGKTSIRASKMVPKTVVSTARATKAVTKAGVHAAKAGMRAGRSLAKNGIRATAKEGVKRITGFATRKFKKLGKGTVKAAGTTMLKAVARILMLIATTLLSVLGPFLLAIIVLCLIVFSVMAFVSSSGDDVYYDAGDEDTELAMQEMVDLLTLCHSSFRAALSDQSGVNAGAEQQQWIQTLESWADEMVKVGAIYENTKNKTPYTEALKQSPVRTNCALLVTHALQKAGIFNTNDKFYGSKDGTLKGSGVEHLRKIANITHYQNGTTRVSDLDLQPGDIVTYYIQHTNVYIGTNGSGQKEWIDAGRGTTINGTNGSKWRSFKTTHTCNAYVSNLIRLNFATSASNSSGGSAKQMKKGDTSKVQGLYDVTQGTWWNYEFTYQYIHGRWAAGTKQRQLDQMFDNGRLTISGNGNYAFVNNKMYMAAFGSYWGETGDVLKVEFNKAIKIGSQPATKILYIIKCDAKAWQHTGYPAEPEGIYGHHLGGHRDFAEFMGYGSQPAGLNGKGIVPVSCTNMGSILDGTFNENLIGTSSLISSSVKSDADIFYRQEIDQQTYRDIINRENNIYYTFPVDQKVPDGITPTPTPKGYDPKTDTGEVYAFYNNNQELISMVNAMFDFDINTATSVKQTIIATQNKSGSDEAAADSAMQRGVTNKINDDTWKLIGFLQQNGMDLTKYKSGGYDDLKYSTLVGLFNASHIITTTDVKQYHKGPDGTINEIKKNGRIVGQNNKDGRAYQVPVIETTYDVIELEDGSHTSVPNTHIKLDANGNIVYQTLYEPCPGHTKQSVAVITLHFDSLLDIQKWWEDNIYSVDDFDKENPDYSSEKKSDPNYRAKSTVLKQSIQIIKKPDFYKALKGTCDEGTASDSNFSPGTMTESQQEVAKACYKYMTKTMNLSNAQAVGVLVNILRESGFRYTAVEEGNGGEGYGLCQWSYGRRTRLVEWCNAHPSDGAYNTLEGQLSFLNAEFTVYPDVWSGDGAGGFRRCQTEREAGEYFLRYFERPNPDNIAQRSNEMESDIATVKKYLRK